MTSLIYTSSHKFAVMYVMSLTRLYMNVIPVLNIRGMLLIYPPFLNHILNQTNHKCTNTK